MWCMPAGRTAVLMTLHKTQEPANKKGHSQLRGLDLAASTHLSWQQEPSQHLSEQRSQTPSAGPLLVLSLPSQELWKNSEREREGQRGGVMRRDFSKTHFNLDIFLEEQNP